jgi:hypothetical protein
VWLLEELGVEYELKTYKRDPKTARADPALAKLHPLGKALLYLKWMAKLWQKVGSLLTT